MGNFTFVISILFLFTTSSIGQIAFTEIIVDENYSGAQPVSVGDLDGDGLQDLICFSSSRTPKWYKNLGSLQFEKRTIVESLYLGIQEEGIQAIDLDNDNDIDIVALKRQANQVYWLENDGQGNFVEHLIDDGSMDAPWSVFVTDVNADASLDILCVGNFSNNLMAFINDGNQGFSAMEIDDDIDHPTSIQSVDFDKDGDQDFLVSSSSTLDDTGVYWYEQTGQASYTKHIIDESFDIHNVFAFDADGDEDLDFAVGSSFDMAIHVYKNDGEQNFESNLVQSDYYGSGVVHAVDLNKDENLDLLGLGYQENEFYWWKNDGNGSFEQQLIDEDYEGATDIMPVDIDNDGDIDLLTSNLRDKQVSIWINSRLSTAIKSAELENSILVFPNPSRDFISINGYEGFSESYSIYDGLGREIQKGMMVDSRISVETLPQGNYWIRFSVRNVSSFVKLD